MGWMDGGLEKRSVGEIQEERMNQAPYCSYLLVLNAALIPEEESRKEEKKKKREEKQNEWKRYKES